MKKKVLTLAVCGMVALICFSANAWAIDATSITDKAGEFISSLAGGTTQSAEVTDTTLENEVEVTDGISVGNSGISVQGETINLQSSDIQNNVKLQNGTSVGNSGISVGN